jgi:glycosyltransferase involved in cell wall biosynthesis
MISLIYPSRGRPSKSYRTFCSWHGKSSGDVQIQTIVSVDQDDDLLSQYIERYPNIAVYRKNTCVVQATNYAAAHSTGDILIYLSDDFDCPEGWDALIEKEFHGVTEPMLLKVDDCLQKFHVPVLTIPIMNRALYEKLGYFWHPDYKSMFVDEDLYWTCKNNGWLKLAPHLKFPHNHVSIGKADNDETYRRSAANWDQGKATFARRKAAGFPL